MQCKHGEWGGPCGTLRATVTLLNGKVSADGLKVSVALQKELKALVNLGEGFVMWD